MRGFIGDMRAKEHVVPFHWQIEFPEAFDRIDSGFDVFIGNPPFMAGKNITGLLGSSYLSWLKESFWERWRTGRPGRLLLSACLLAPSAKVGAFGLLATNTIAQGDTRTASLAPIVAHGGSIFNATKRLEWPGRAAVIVSVVHIAVDSRDTFPFC